MDLAIERMPLLDESYLCLLCLRDSTERIAHLYLTYIKLRQQYSHEAPLVLFTALLILHDKHKGLEEKLQENYPEYMTSAKWHSPEEQNEQLDHMTQESCDDLHQLCSTEMKLLVLITELMKQQ